MTYDIERGGMSYMRPGKVKEVGLDIVADIVGSFFIAVGVYNFAVASGFPVLRLYFIISLGFRLVL